MIKRKIIDTAGIAARGEQRMSHKASRPIMPDNTTRPSPKSSPSIRPSHLVAVFLLFLLLGVVTAALGAALPNLRSIFRLGDQGGSWLVTTYNLGALAAILGCGFGNRYFTPRRAVNGLLALFALGSMGMGIAGSWPIFCLTTIVAGAGYGGLVLYLNSIVARRFDEHSFLMLNLINAMFGAGAILGPLAVGFANEHTKTIFLVAGILSIPCLAAGALGDRLSQPHEPQPAKNRRTQLRVTLALLGLGFLYSGVETGAGAWEATQLSWSGHTASDAARLACLFWVGLCVGRFLASPILASRAPTALMTIALLAAGTSLLFATQPHAAPYAYAICGLFLAPVLPAALEWISQNIADNQRANALLFTVSMAGSAALPALIGALARPASPELIPLTIALIAVLAAGTSRSLTRIGRSMG